MEAAAAAADDSTTTETTSEIAVSVTTEILTAEEEIEAAIEAEIAAEQEAESETSQTVNYDDKEVATEWVEFEDGKPDQIITEEKILIIMDDAKLEEMGADVNGIVPVSKLEEVDLETL